MLASLSRIVTRKVALKFPIARTSNSVPLPRSATSKAISWHKNAIRKYAMSREEQLRALGAPEEGALSSFNMKEITDTITQQMPSEDELRRFAQTYAEQSGDRLTLPPSISTEPKVIEFNKTLRSHASRQQYDILLLKFMQIHQRAILPDCETFGIVLEAIIDRKDFQLVEPIDSLMATTRMPKTLDLINTIMKYAAASGNSQRASIAFKELLTEAKLAPNIRTVEYYMIAHAKAKHLEIVMECFKQYPEKWNLQRDSSFHGAFIEALLINGKEEMALKRWEAMKAGKLPYPTNKAIQVMLEYYASKENYDALNSLFLDINDKFGLFPDKANCETFLESKMKLGKVDEAMKIVERQALELWHVSGNVMIQLMTEYAKRGDRTTVEKLWALAPKVGFRPNQAALTTVVTACCNAQKPDRAMAFMSIGQDKYGIIPNRIMYAALITSFGKLEELSKCLTLYRRMALQERILPGPTTFVALLSAYAHAGEFDAILRMLENPASHGIPRENRHFFEDIIEAIRNDDPTPLASLLHFDWTRLKGITSETPEELAYLTKSLSSPRAM